MKTMKKTTASSPIRHIRYDDWHDIFHINDVTIPVNTGWNSRMFGESYYCGVPERDAVLERLVQTVNSMLVDYHYHRRELRYFDEFWDTWTDWIGNQDTIDDSLAILDEAWSYSAELLLSCLEEGWENRCRYIEASLCLMREICSQRRNLHAYCKMSDALQTVLQDNWKDTVFSVFSFQ